MDSEDPRERRKTARIPIDELVSCTPFVGSSSLGQGVDVSLGGIRFRVLGCQLAQAVLRVLRQPDTNRFAGGRSPEGKDTGRDRRPGQEEEEGDEEEEAPAPDGPAGGETSLSSSPVAGRRLAHTFGDGRVQHDFRCREIGDQERGQRVEGSQGRSRLSASRSARRS